MNSDFGALSVRGECAGRCVLRVAQSMASSVLRIVVAFAFFFGVAHAQDGVQDVVALRLPGRLDRPLQDGLRPRRHKG
jgi:hypothetical protein